MADIDVAYADSTALISLARVGRLDLLRVAAAEIRVTEVVWSEVVGRQLKAGVDALNAARDAGLFFVVDEGDSSLFPDLGRGEASVLSAAAAAGALIIIDELRARKLIASTSTLQRSITGFTGVMGLLIRAKQTGAILEVRPLLDQLRSEEFRISSSLRTAVLQMVGEL